MKRKLAIFDMDGTLFDTNDVNYYAYREALEKFGVELDHDYYCEYCNGRHYKVFLPELLEGDMERVEVVHDVKKEKYANHLDKVRINKALFEVMGVLAREYAIALVTTASRKNTEEILKYAGVADRFDLILTAEEIEKPKPDPEGFLCAMKQFEVESKDTIIFEDSDVGVEAAKAVGALVCRVENFKKRERMEVK